MDDYPVTREASKWPKRLALVFILLFALFWSLGPFFFWILLGLSTYFGFLALISSESIKASVSDMLSSFGSQQSSRNPYPPDRPQTVTQEPGSTPRTAMKFIRVFIIIFMSLFIFLFLVGVFVGKDGGDGDPASETIESTGTTSEADGSELWNDRGNASLADSKYDSALFYYNKALAIDPENTYALYNKGLAYTLQQDYKRANRYARKCVRFHPDYDPAWWLLGYNYDLMNNLDSAVYCMEKAYRNDYSQPDFLQLMAEVYVKKDRRKDALEAYKKLVTQDTTQAEIFRKMAELDPANAETYRRKVATLEK